MANDVYGTVFRNAGATFLARIANDNGTFLKASEIESLVYTIYVLDNQRPDFRESIFGHQRIFIIPDAVFSETLQTGDIWKADSIGYNFRHTISTNQADPFPESGRNYLVEYRISPKNSESFLVRFRVNSI
jgi:hypothetical protein